jgi:AcrR family transcriptional regulator
VEPAERREQILSHAAELFGSQGYHATSVADIISAAGVARGTFYLYFASKRAIFEELVDGLLVLLHQQIRIVDVSAGAPSAREQLVDNITRVIQVFVDQRSLLAILLESAVGVDQEFDEKLAEFYGKVTETIEASLLLGQEMNLVRQCDTRIGALAALGALKEVLHDLLHDKAISDIDLQRKASEILDIFSHGFLAEGVSIP